MKKYFFLGTLLLALFESANAFYIMPIPGSREMETIGLAYFLFSWKWTIRILCVLMIVLGLKAAWQHSKAFTISMLIFTGAILYLANFQMKPDKIYYEPKSLIMRDGDSNRLPGVSDSTDTKP